MKVVVDPTRCGGIGLCEVTAANVFEVGDDGMARVVCDEVASDALPAVLEAIDSCPTRALSVQE